MKQERSSDYGGAVSDPKDEMTRPLTSTRGTVHLHKSRHVVKIWKCTRRDRHRRPKVQRVQSKHITCKKKGKKNDLCLTRNKEINGMGKPQSSFPKRLVSRPARATSGVQSILETGSPAPFESRNLCDTNLPYLNLRRGQHGINNRILTLTKSKTPAHRLKFGHWRQPR